MNALKKKMSNTKGESISEVMISGLIIALGLLLAASMIVASTNIVKKSSAAWGNYFWARNAIEAEKDLPSEDYKGTYSSDTKAVKIGSSSVNVIMNTSTSEDGSTKFITFKKSK